ncbi:Chitinase 3 [Lachnellula arida]|uniref:Chitinase 3 n=1 Tax=Lachnellula arida TaxID=1316785 RepID=A0A8T9B5T0_9HELO|nr:Chitinase 3 [Lachnellula arida]
MHYPQQFLRTILFLPALSPNLPLVCALKLPFGHSKEPRRHDAKTVDVKLPDMGFVKTYVCPAKADLFRRQSVPPVITLPQADLQPFLLALRETEVQMIAIIDAMLRDEGSVMPSDTCTCVFSSIPTLIPTLTLISTPTPTPTPTLPVPDSIPSSPLTSTLTLTTRTTTTITIFTPATVTKTRSESLDAVSTIPSSQDAMDTVPVAALSTTTSPQTTLDTVPVAAPNTATNPQTTMNTVPVAALSTTISVPSNLSTTVPLPSSTSTLSVVQDLQLPDYTFDATSSKNIAVYFGRSPATRSSSLEAQCADPNIDIVILAFVIPQQDGSKYPSTNFGPTCNGQTDAMRASAPDKVWEESVVEYGGITGGFNFGGDGQAAAFADTLWGLFGPVGSVDIMLRPFGGVEVDGFDVGEMTFASSFFLSSPSPLRSIYPPRRNDTIQLVNKNLFQPAQTTKTTTQPVSPP